MSSLPENTAGDLCLLLQGEVFRICSRAQDKFNRPVWMIVAVYSNICWDRWNTVVEMFSGSYGDAITLWHLYVQHHRPQNDPPVKVRQHELTPEVKSSDRPIVFQELEYLYDAAPEEYYSLKLVYCPRGLTTVSHEELIGWFSEEARKKVQQFQPPSRRTGEQSTT